MMCERGVAAGPLPGVVCGLASTGRAARGGGREEGRGRGEGVRTSYGLWLCRGSPPAGPPHVGRRALTTSPSAARLSDPVRPGRGDGRGRTLPPASCSVLQFGCGVVLHRYSATRRRQARQHYVQATRCGRGGEGKRVAPRGPGAGQAPRADDKPASSTA